MRRAVQCATGGAVSLFLTLPAIAQTAPADQQLPSAPAEQASPTPGQSGAGAPPQSPAPEAPTGIWQRSNLLGDIDGLRTLLGSYGISLGLSNTSEVFGNVSGGIQRGASGDGLTQFGIGVDTEKAFGWKGGTFDISGLWIYGPNFSTNYLGVLQTNSGILAEPTVRLWEAWYQQVFLDGRADVKLGLQSVDQEFMVSQNSLLFLNTVMGWPMIPSADLYAGGPAYPLSSLGVRLRGRVNGNLTLLGGVFQDNPPGGPFNDDGQLRGSTRWGGNFNLRTGALFLAEAQYGVPGEGAPVTNGAKGPLPATYKIGFWFDTAQFPDQRYDNTGLSLANPNSTGIPAMHQGNFGIYGVVDQTVWAPGGDNPRALSLFLRPMGAPTGDRKLINFSVNGGMTYKAPLPGRDDDTFGIGFGVANVSSRAAGLDQDTAFFSGTYVPVRGAETFLEITYQAQIAPWWQIQPDFQYYWMPGGGVLNPTDPTQRIGNEAVFGLRTNVTF